MGGRLLGLCGAMAAAYGLVPPCPVQDRDLAKEQPDVAARLSKALDQWKAEMLPGLKKDDRPFPVGYPECPITQLPARDGVPHGNVERSAGAPNCSYFTNWTAAEDTMTWDVEVATAGGYEAAVCCTCAKADIGPPLARSRSADSTIELSLNGSRIQATVGEANDPPLRGAEHDRVKRKGESYVKDFKPLRLGVVELKQGRGLLTLRALKVAGPPSARSRFADRQVMDVRMILLTLLR